MADHYMSACGEPIPTADYDRWIRQAADAFHCLDENNGLGTEGKDRQAQFSDLLCHLMHLAQAVGIDFDAQLERAQDNYTQERRKRVPTAATRALDSAPTNLAQESA